MDGFQIAMLIMCGVVAVGVLIVIAPIVVGFLTIAFGFLSSF